MIASLAGTVKSVASHSAVIEVGGIGIQVHLTLGHAASMLVGTFSYLHTTLIVREDALTLYGFESAAGREIFDLLQTVTGIGPRVAQSALSVYDATEIASAIRTQDQGSLERIPGLGKKGAARVVLELHDKIENLHSFAELRVRQEGGWRVQLDAALVGLGFTKKESEDSLDAVAAKFSGDLPSTPIAELLRFALQSRGRK